MLLILLLLSACAPATVGISVIKAQEQPAESKTGLNGPVIENIKKKGRLTAATSAEYPPYEFYKNVNGRKEIAGLDIDIAEEIAAELNVVLAIKDMKYDELMRSLASGKCDIAIAALAVKEDKKELCDFTDVYYRAEQGVLIRMRDKDKYTKIEDLAGKKVGMLKNTTQQTLVEQQLPDSIEIPAKSFEKLISYLETGGIEAALLDKPVAEYYMKNSEGLYLSGITLKVENEGTAIAVAKGNEDFLSVLNGIIYKLNKNGKIKEYFVKAVFDSVS